MNESMDSGQLAEGSDEEKIRTEKAKNYNDAIIGRL